MEKATLQAYTERCGTPFYVFDADQLQARLAYLRKQLLPRIALCYAIKANPFITKEAAPFVDRLEICSEGEYRICETLKLAPESFVISGVNKNPEFIKELVSTGVNIGVYTIESMEHFVMLEAASREAGRQITVMPRLTSGNQFGLDEAELETIIRHRADYPLLNICGVQYFSGTQKTSLKKLRRELEYVDAFVQKLQDQYDFTCREVEFGPGFPVYYFEGETFDEDAFIAGVNELIEAMTFQGAITFELGRSIAASCGSYVTRVVDTKCNRAENYAIVDGGMHQITYYGQFMAMKFPKITHISDGDGETKKWTLCGSLCSINDLLVKQYPFCGLQKGDYLIFENAGAYCMTEGISLFLSRDLPVILLKKADDVLVLRDRFYSHELNTPKY